MYKLGIIDFALEIGAEEKPIIWETKPVKADSTGQKMRLIRYFRKLSQAQLGEKVGLSSDRIQKYENGARKPKWEYLEKFADALEVNVLALKEAAFADSLSAMYVMFDLVDQFGMRLEKTNDEQSSKISLSIGFENPLYGYMEKWYEVLSNTQIDLSHASSDSEREEILNRYYDWKWNFPNGITYQPTPEQQKLRLQRKIAELTDEYNKLVSDTSEPTE